MKPLHGGFRVWCNGWCESGRRIREEPYSLTRDIP